MLLVLAVVGRSAVVCAEPLTERAAVARALAASPLLRAEAADMRAAEAAVGAEEARYTPTFYAGAEGGHTESLGAAGGDVVATREDAVEVSTGVLLGSAWGTTLDVGVAGHTRATDADRDALAGFGGATGPVYGAEVRVQVTQPLLRGAGADVGEAELRAARHARTAASEDERLATSTLVRDVLLAHRELWYAQEAEAVERGALALAERQLAEARATATGIGTTAEADTLRFESAVAELESGLARAEATREARSLALAVLLGIATDEGRALRAEDGDPLVPVAAPPGDVVAAALAASPELAALDAAIAEARVQAGVLEDARAPRLDLEASLAAGGVWNDATISSLGLPSDRPALTALVGLRFELPVRSTRADAQLAGARATIEAAEARRESRRLALAVEARTHVSELSAALRRTTLAERAESVAARLADAEGARLALGLTTPLQVVEAREQHRAAALTRLRAAVDASSAAIAVAHLTGALLPDARAGGGER